MLPAAGIERVDQMEAKKKPCPENPGKAFLLFGDPHYWIDGWYLTEKSFKFARMVLSCSALAG